MKRVRTWTPAVLSLGLAACAASPAAPAAEAPAAEASRGELEKASRVEQALLVSELMTLGFREGFRHALAARPDGEQITQCFVGKMAPVAVEFAARSVWEACTAEQLNRGARLASAPVFAEVHRYIRGHLDSLAPDAKATGKRVDEELLLLAAARLGLPAAEQAKVADFVAWHQGIAEKQSAAMKAGAAALKVTGVRVGKECVAAPR